MHSDRCQLIPYLSSVVILSLQEQIVKINKEFRCMQQKYDKKVDCLNQQIYEYQKQIEQVGFIAV